MIFQPANRFLPSDVELSNTVRRRWMDLSVWLRDLIHSQALNLDNLEPIRKRLDKIAEDADLFYTLYYGPETGDRVNQIYKSYFNDVQNMVKAYKENDLSVIERHRQSMYQSSIDLGRLLSRINRYWDAATMQALFDVLVENTENQIKNIVRGSYEEEIASYDEYVDQIYRISDEITYGMIQQFRVPR